MENENMKKRIIVFAIGLTALAGLAVRAFPALSRFGASVQSADREVTNRHAQHIFTMTPRPSSPTTIPVGTLLLMARSHYARLRLKSLGSRSTSTALSSLTSQTSIHLTLKSPPMEPWHGC